MKKIIIALFLIFFAANVSFAYEPNYRQIYMDTQMPDFSYLHGVDPGQYFDNKDAAYSIYPLFKLCTPIYLKAITITPGYYALTPRAHKGKDYLLFKQNGGVRHIVPVYKKEIVPQGFYEAHIPQPKLGRWDTIRKNFFSFIGKHFASSQRKPTVQSFLEVNDLDNKFVSIVVYYGNYRYYTIFRTVQM